MPTILLYIYNTMKIKFILVFILASLAGFSQVTFRVISLPSNTPTSAPIYIAGSFNSWNPASAIHQLQDLIDGDPAITLDISGSITCKFTRGSWETVEGNANGGFLPDRQFTVNSGDTVLIGIQSWEDLGGTSTGTALPSVSMISSAFNIPELNRTRRIWVCLPEDYASQPEKRYRVLYMQDGQNLFNNSLAFAGEWEVDESMRDLFLAGDEGAIVIGIDNGGAERLNEYSPWENPSYGGGDGDAYVDFMRNTLKPYVDANYRTLTEPENTGVAGSSIGGLISMYAAMRYPDTFGKAGIFSPAFWFAESAMHTWMNGLILPSSLRVYFVAGTTESSSMVPDINQMRNLLAAAGVADSNLRVVPEADGAHSEWFWNREFPEAYTWLWDDVSTSIPVEASKPIMKLYPNPVESVISICRESNEVASFGIRNLTGQLLNTGWLQQTCDQISVSGFSAGVYIMEVKENDGSVSRNRFVVK